MKKVDEILGYKPKKKALLTKKMQAQFREWALDAHKLDNSRSPGYYYKMYVSRLRQKYQEATDKSRFFTDGVIEV